MSCGCSNSPQTNFSVPKVQPDIVYLKPPENCAPGRDLQPDIQKPPELPCCSTLTEPLITVCRSNPVISVTIATRKDVVTIVNGGTVPPVQFPVSITCSSRNNGCHLDGSTLVAEPACASTIAFSGLFPTKENPFIVWESVGATTIAGTIANSILTTTETDDMTGWMIKVQGNWVTLAPPSVVANRVEYPVLTVPANVNICQHFYTLKQWVSQAEIDGCGYSWLVPPEVFETGCTVTARFVVPGFPHLSQTFKFQGENC